MFLVELGESDRSEKVIAMKPAFRHNSSTNNSTYHNSSSSLNHNSSSSSLNHNSSSSSLNHNGCHIESKNVGLDSKVDELEENLIYPYELMPLPTQIAGHGSEGDGQRGILK